MKSILRGRLSVPLSDVSRSHNPLPPDESEQDGEEISAGGLSVGTARTISLTEDRADEMYPKELHWNTKDKVQTHERWNNLVVKKISEKPQESHTKRDNKKDYIARLVAPVTLDASIVYSFHYLPEPITRVIKDHYYLREVEVQFRHLIGTSISPIQRFHVMLSEAGLSIKKTTEDAVYCRFFDSPLQDAKPTSNLSFSQMEDAKAKENRFGFVDIDEDNPPFNVLATGNELNSNIEDCITVVFCVHGCGGQEQAVMILALFYVNY